MIAGDSESPLTKELNNKKLKMGVKGFLMIKKRGWFFAAAQMDGAIYIALPALRSV